MFIFVCSCLLGTYLANTVLEIKEAHSLPNVVVPTLVNSINNVMLYKQHSISESIINGLKNIN